MRKFTLAALVLTLMALSGPAQAAWYINDDGTGFVGKGDVQLAFGWNNKQLQDNAGGVSFSVSTHTSTTTTWTCDKVSGTQTQERANTTTTTTQGVFDSIARERNQITGFNLNGWSGTPQTSDEHEGPAVGSCPTGWTAIDLQVGDPVVEGGGLSVHHGDLSVSL